MSTVGKALSLLDLLTVDEPGLGLSEIARRSGFDKATTRRLLMSLCDQGFIEQDAKSRSYYLGPALSRLARVREVHFPFLRVAAPLVRALAQETEETVHLSEYGAGRLVTVHVEESSRAHRVGVDIGMLLPLHATASGIAFLAHTRPDIVEEALSGAFDTFTPFTVTDRQRLRESIITAAQRGYSHGDQGYEEGVFSVGAAVLGSDGYAIGALAVASPVSRMDERTAFAHGEAAAKTGREIARRLFGTSVSIDNAPSGRKAS